MHRVDPTTMRDSSLASLFPSTPPNARSASCYIRDTPSESFGQKGSHVITKPSTPEDRRLKANWEFGRYVGL